MKAQTVLYIKSTVLQQYHSFRNVEFSQGTTEPQFQMEAMKWVQSSRAPWSWRSLQHGSWLVVGLVKHGREGQQREHRKPASTVGEMGRDIPPGSWDETGEAEQLGEEVARLYGLAEGRHCVGFWRWQVGLQALRRAERRKGAAGVSRE